MRGFRPGTASVELAKRLWLGWLVVWMLATLVVAPAAPAAPVVTAKGKPVASRRLATAVRLPTGQRSTMTFVLRRGDGVKVRGFAVGSTRYYENFNLGGNSRIPRSAAYRMYRRHPGYCVGGELVFRPYLAQGRTYRVLVRVQYAIVGE